MPAVARGHSTFWTAQGMGSSSHNGRSQTGWDARSVSEQKRAATHVELKHNMKGQSRLSNLNSHMPKRSKTESTHLEKHWMFPAIPLQNLVGCGGLPAHP